MRGSSRRLLYISFLVLLFISQLQFALATCTQTAPTAVAYQLWTGTTVQQTWTTTGVTGSGTYSYDNIGSETLGPDPRLCDVEGQVYYQWRSTAITSSADGEACDASTSTYSDCGSVNGACGVETTGKTAATGYTIDWDADSNDCECNFGAGRHRTDWGSGDRQCCGGDGAADDMSVDSSGTCYMCLNSVYSTASCASGSSSCSDDGYVSAGTCYYDESCASSGYTAPSTATCSNAACTSDGVDDSGTCVYDEACGTTGRVASEVSCATGSSTCSDDGYENAGTCYYNEACTGTGYTAPSTCASDADTTCTGTGCVDCAPYTRSAQTTCNTNCNGDLDANCISGYTCLESGATDVCIADASKTYGQTCDAEVQCAANLGCTGGVCLRDNGQSCTIGNECSSNTCVAGTCRASCNSYDKSQCSTDGATYNGGTAGVCEDTTDTCDYDEVADTTVAGSGLLTSDCSASGILNRCDSDGSTFGFDGACNSANGCTTSGTLTNTGATSCASAGNVCDSDVGTSYAIDGLCASGACTTNTNLVAKNGATYYDSCTNSYECDSSLSGASYARDGYCCGGCQVDGTVTEGNSCCGLDISCSDATNALSCYSGTCLRDDGESCTLGTQCGAGVCSGSGVCCNKFVDVNDNGLFDDSDCACSPATNGHKCDVDKDMVWDGICAYNGATWSCDVDDVYNDGTYYRTTYSGTSVDGYPCDADVAGSGFEQDGLAADGSCDAAAPIVCDLGAGTDCNSACDATNGYQCDSNVLSSEVSFAQTGTCTVSGCDATADLCYNDESSQYVDSCGSCSTDSNLDAAGDSCDSSASFGGSFSADGMCVTGGTCDTDGDICIDRADDLFKSDCSVCGAGTVCDDSGTQFSANGHCSDSNCCTSDYIDVDNDGSFNDDSACQACGSGVKYRKCSSNFDYIWDGACANYGSGYSCDATLWSATIDSTSNIDDPTEVLDSTLTAVTSINTEFRNSTVEDSTTTDSIITTSTIISSKINSSTFYGSVVYNSQICSGVTGYDVMISNNVIISGAVEIGGQYYYSPANMNMVCSGSSLDAVGYVSFNASAVSDGSSLAVYYISSEIGYTVTVDLTNIGGGASVSMLDDGVGSDKIANDGIYTAVASSINTGSADESRQVTVDIISISDSWSVSNSILVDNTDPTASFRIYNLQGEEDNTASPSVVLETTYSDNLVLKGCRFANENPGDLASQSYAPCQSSLYWSLEYTNGTKTVYMEVSDLAGNSVIVSDSIFFNTSLSTDITPPTLPTVLDDGMYSNDNDSLHFRWYNATDQEQAILFVDISYDYWLYNGTDYTNHGQTTATELTLTGLTLTEGSSYTLLVSAYNIAGLYSENASSDGIVTDFTAPSVTTLTTNADPTGWNSGGRLEFNMSAVDAHSGIAGYSVSLSTNANINPDDIVDTNFSFSYVNLPDGFYTFKAKAVDLAGNVGPIVTYIFKADNTPPTVPQLFDFKKNATNSTELFFEWTKSVDVSGIQDYYVEIALDSEFSNVIYSTNLGNVTSFTYIASPGNYVYFARVQAENGVGLWSLFSSDVSDEVDLKPPVVTFKKPRGSIIASDPILTIETDELAYCNYKTGMDPFLPFDFTNLNHHEIKLGLVDGQSYVYDIHCVDLVGNEVYDSVSFTINSLLTPDSLTLESDYATLYSNQITLLNVTVLDGGVGVGELVYTDFSLTVNGNVLDVVSGEFVVADYGDGQYVLAFETPNASSVVAEVGLPGYSLSDSKTYSVSELTLDTGCTGDSCDLIVDGSSLTPTYDDNPFIVSIIFDSVNVCSGSKAELDVGDCIKIESQGDGTVCVAFVEDCNQDTVIGTV